MSLNILNSNTKSSRKAKILPQFSISSENKPLLDLLEIQRKSFFDFLQHGIPHELAKIAVFREIAKNSTYKQELELKFNPETYKFISPNFTPKEAILNGKTYACKVYVQATLMIRSPYDIQKTNLIPVQSFTLQKSMQSKALQSVVQKEKVKQKLNFYPSFADKNKRLNASKLLHNTYTKWLQSSFLSGDSLQSFVLQSCLSAPLTRFQRKLPTFGLTNNGSETKKERKNFYSLSLNTDSLTHNKSSIWLPLQGMRSKVNTTQNSTPSAMHTPLGSTSFATLTGYKGQGVSLASARIVPLPLRGTGVSVPRRGKGIRYKSSICKRFLQSSSCNSKRKNNPSTQNIQIFRPWIFLGELPLMTKRGHFILNGSPRVIVNQIARCPGIYFQEKRRGVGIEQEIRVSADLIPQRGPWLRVQSDWEGRFWARLKQEGRVKYATLYEAFQEFEKEYNSPLICLLSNTNSIPSATHAPSGYRGTGVPPVSARVIPTLFSKSETATFQERKIKEDRQKKALIRLFKNSSRYSLGKLGRSRVNERTHFTFTRPPYKEITNLTSYGDANRINLNWEPEADEKLVLPKGSVNKNKELYSFLNEGNLLLSHEKNFSEILQRNYNYFYPLLQQRQELRRNSSPFGAPQLRFTPMGYSRKPLYPQLGFTPMGYSRKPLQGTRVAKLVDPKGVKGMELTSCVNESRQPRKNFFTPAGYGVILPQHDEPLLPQQEELMAKDLDAIHTCLERLLEGQGFTDDIDNLKNRFIRTSGKLLQQQFELGLFRLNDVIMPLLGNLLPNYSRLTKSKELTNKNMKGIPLPLQSKEFALQDVNLVDKLDKVKSTRVSNKDTNNSFNANSNDSSFGVAHVIVRDKIIPFTGATSYPQLRFTPMGYSRKPFQGIGAFRERAAEEFLRSFDDNSIPSATLYPYGVQQKAPTGYWSCASERIIAQRKVSEKSCCLKGNIKFQNWQTKQPKNKNLMYLNLTSALANLIPYKGKPFVRAKESVAEQFDYLSLRQQKELPRYNFCPSRRKSFTPTGYCNSLTPYPQLRFTPMGYNRKPLQGLPASLPLYPVKGIGVKELCQRVGLTNCVNESLADGSSKEVSFIKNAPFRWLRTSKPINSAFREFFGSNPLSQYMDQTNPLAEITHKRRLSSMGPGGIKRETAGMEVRGIHPTHYGRVCPIETPEGKNAGLVNSPTVYSRVGNYGFLETPLYQVIENQVQTKRWTFFSAQHEEKQNSSLATCDTGLLQFNFLAHVPIPVQTANNPLTHFQQIERHRVGYRALSPIQAISIATALIPFLEHDDANRALMGSNMQRQAIPLLSPERPIVGTGFEPLVVMESGQALQATKLGCVSQVDANSIIVHTKYSIEKPLPQPVFTRYDNSIPSATLYPYGVQQKAPAGYKGNQTGIGYKGKETPLPLYPERVAGLVDPEGVKGIELGVPSEFLSLTQLLSEFHTLYPCRVQGLSAVPYKYKGKGQLRSPFTPAGYGARVYTATDIDTNTEKKINLTRAQYLPKKGLLCFTPKSKICVQSKALLRTANGYKSSIYTSAKSKNNYVTKKYISSSHNTFLLRPLKQDLQFYERSNQETCLNQRPLVQEGDWIQKGDFLADSSASHSGDLALGKNVTVAYMPWEGYNFEDAIVISDRLVSDDIYTSLHIERYEIKVSKNSQGKERITNRVPGSSHSLKHLDNFGIARISSWVQPGDILVGKVVELKRPLSPYERLAWELASRLSPKSPEREKWLNKVWLEDISLRLPAGVCGRVINSQIISSSTEYASMSDMSFGAGAAIPTGVPLNKEQTILEKYPQEVHLYLAVKRKIQIGDKLAGRHGNKGIVSAILPQEDMPYLGDGGCIDMVLNPLGVPSRMNLGQIFECLLGLAGSQLGCNFRITPFDEIAGGEASRSLVFLKLYQCRLMYKQQWLFTPTFPGKSKLFDGRTGEPFENWVTVGQAYMLKLIHMVDHKIHARSTGPYSLFTRQPVRGRSRRGGQRLGEMEVWAVEGFGAAYTLQEFLTIKSDDLKARTALQKGFYKQNDVTFGKIHIAPGNPEAFKVLVSELQALCLHIQM